MMLKFEIRSRRSRQALRQPEFSLKTIAIMSMQQQQQQPDVEYALINVVFILCNTCIQVVSMSKHLMICCSSCTSKGNRHWSRDNTRDY